MKHISRRNFLIAAGLGLSSYLTLKHTNLFKSKEEPKIMDPNMIRADLHQHLLIGFQDYWIKNQIGDLKKNLLEILIDECHKKDIGICAITSQYLDPHIKNPEFELIHDRFEYLKREADRLKGYSIETNSDDVYFKIKGNNKELIVLSSQAVCTETKGRRIDTIVLGNSRIPNGKPIDYTLDYTTERGFINIAEHPAAPGLYSIGDRLNEFLDRYDAIEWNGQMIIPKWVKHIPKIGKLVGSANKENNEKVIKMSKDLGKPLVSVSDAHCPKDVGIASIEFKNELISEENLLGSLKEIITQNNFKPIFGESKFITLLKWRKIYYSGIKFYKEEPHIENKIGNSNLYLKGFKN